MDHTEDDYNLSDLWYHNIIIIIIIIIVFYCVYLIKNPIADVAWDLLYFYKN
jgi:hypothetical protein